MKTVRIEGHELIHPGPGDTVVLKVDMRRIREIPAIQEMLKEIFPDNRVVVLDRDLSLEAITPEGMERLAHPLRSVDP